MVALAVERKRPPSPTPTYAGEPGRCCLCGDFTQRSLCVYCRLQYSITDTTGRLVCPDWLKAIQREAHRLDKRAYTMIGRGQRLQTFSEAALDMIAADSLVLVADLATTPDELPPAPALIIDEALVLYWHNGRVSHVALAFLRQYRHGVPLDMREFLYVLDVELGWPPLGTGYAAEHRDQVLAVYEAVYGL